MGQYRKKPVVIDAWQFDGSFASFSSMAHELGEREDFYFVESLGPPEIRISTLEGEMTASRGDFIIRGVKGELYPCKPDIFVATYEPA